MLNNYVNFDFSILKKLPKFSREKLVNIYQVGMGVGINIHDYQPTHLCTKNRDQPKHFYWHSASVHYHIKLSDLEGIALASSFGGHPDTTVL